MRINYDRCRLARREQLKLLAVLVIAVLAVSILFYDSFMPLVAVLFLWFPVCRKEEQRKAEKQREQVIQAFRDVCFCMSSSFATGRHMSESLRDAETEMRRIYPEEHPIVKELSWMNHRTTDLMESDIHVLKDFAVRTGSEDIDDFVTAYRSCRQTGGNLSRIMEQCSGRIAEKITIESEIRSMAVQKKYEGRIITLMPAAIILFLRIVSPDYVGILYGGWFGRILMTIALFATCAAFVLIERITSIDV